MRSLVIAGAFLLVGGASAPADDNAVSQSTLDGMGLGTMQRISDQEGTLVRGKFTGAGVWGNSLASWGGTSSTNSYFASSSWQGPVGSSAIGGSHSFSSNFQFRQFSF